MPRQQSLWTNFRASCDRPDPSPRRFSLNSTGAGSLTFSMGEPVAIIAFSQHGSTYVTTLWISRTAAMLENCLPAMAATRKNLRDNGARSPAHRLYNASPAGYFSGWEHAWEGTPRWKTCALGACSATMKRSTATGAIYASGCRITRWRRAYTPSHFPDWLPACRSRPRR